MSDLIRRSDAIDAIEEITWYHQNRNGEMVSGANSDEHQAWYKSQDIYTALESLPSAEPKTDGVFIQGGLTISGEPPMPEGCMDCKLQDRCLCIPPDLSADEISELYISRRPNCPLLMVAEPKTGEWIQKDMYADRFCSECNYAVWDSEAEEYNYCPNCGARMLREDGEA